MYVITYRRDDTVRRTAPIDTDDGFRRVFQLLADREFTIVGVSCAVPHGEGR